MGTRQVTGTSGRGAEAASPLELADNQDVSSDQIIETQNQQNH